MVPPLLVTDAGYGNNAEFRDRITAHGWRYVCQVNGALTEGCQLACVIVQRHFSEVPSPVT